VDAAEPERVRGHRRRHPPEQVRENVKAAGVRLDAGLMSGIDEALGGVVIRDPARTASPKSRP
jgi:hypothetical protein